MRCKVKLRLSNIFRVMIHIGSSRLQNPVSEAAEQRAGQAEEPELIHGVRT